VLLFMIDGEFYAYEDRCSHADVTLNDGQIDLKSCQITCPKHGATFDIKTGEALTPPAIVPVVTFDVRVEGENIQIARKTHAK
ncbi:MAG: Rieske 2Fe-2S domain-containing protein, partial [Chloroflexota bacterium]